MTDELLTPSEVADMLRTGVKTLAYWRHTGYGPAWIPLGRRVTYARSAVTAFLAEQAARGQEAAERARAG
jgi:predicted site-specific integrase-resolvase